MFISISMQLGKHSSGNKVGREGMFKDFKYRTKLTGLSNPDDLIKKLKQSGIITNAETISKMYTTFKTKYGTIFYLTKDKVIYLCSDKDGQAKALQSTLKAHAHKSPVLNKVMDAILDSFKALSIPVKREGTDIVATIDNDKYALALTPLH